MSFSTDVKRELITCKLRGRDVRRMQLAGLTHAVGSLLLGRAPGVEYATETHEVGLQIAALATELYEVDAQVAVKSGEHRRLTITVVSLSGSGVEALLADCGLFLQREKGVGIERRVPDTVFEAPSLGKAFLRGAFLGAGSLSNPKRAYHMEIVCGSEVLAGALCRLMEDFHCGAKTVRRKERTVVYLKEGDRIASFLAWIGAPAATLAFEDARAERELRNYINRTSNCETANIGKTVYAAGEQIDAIEKIKAAHGLERLSPALREMAELRLNYPEASLQELSELAGVGRSGVNHRLQRLIRLAEELR